MKGLVRPPRASAAAGAQSSPSLRLAAAFAVASALLGHAATARAQPDLIPAEWARFIVLEKRAEAELEAEDPQRAAELEADALRLIDGKVRDDHPAAARGLESLALYVRAADPHADVGPKLERAFAIRERQARKAPKEVLRAWSSLDAAFEAWRGHEEARIVLERALALAARTRAEPALRASMLADLGLALLGLGRRADGEARLDEAMAFREAAGEASADQPREAVRDLALRLLAGDAAPSAFRVLDRAFAVARAASDSIEMGRLLVLRAEVRRRMDDRGGARRDLSDAIAALDRAGSAPDAELLAAIDAAAALAYEDGAFAEMVPWLERAAAVSPAGSNERRYREVRLAKLIENTGDVVRAERLYRAATVIPQCGDDDACWDAAWARDPVPIALARSGLAMLLAYRGDVVGAARLAATAEDDLSAEQDPPPTVFRHAGGVRARTARGELFSERERARLALDEAVRKVEEERIQKPLTTDELEAYARARDPSHVGAYAHVLADLGGLARLFGDAEGAERFYSRALRIDEAARGPDDPSVALDLASLGALALDRRDVDAAERHLGRALAILEAKRGADHPSVAAVVANLAAACDQRHDWERARPLHERVVRVLSRAFGPEHPRVATALFNQATALREKGDFEQAEALDLRALAIRRARLSPDDPVLAESIEHLGTLRALRGDAPGAIAAYTEKAELEERSLTSILAFGSDAQKASTMASLGRRTDVVLTLEAEWAPPGDPAAMRLGLTTVLRRKGRALEASANAARARRGPLPEAARAELDRVRALRARLAWLSLSDPHPETQAGEAAALADEARRLEAGISARLADGRALRAASTLVEVQAAVPKGAALVEYALYHPFSPRAALGAPQWRQARYRAYVLASTGIAAVDLGDAAAIDAGVAALRSALADPARADVRELARRLDTMIFQPVRARLGDERRVFVAPDGNLSLVPFGALVDEHWRWILESLDASYVTSGRDMLGWAAREEARMDPVIFAAPAFGAATGAPDVAVDPEPASSRGALANALFPPLPGTAEEGRARASLLGRGELHEGAAATKPALLALRGPSLLHVATHGFFVARRASSTNAPLPAGPSRALVLASSAEEASPSSPMGVIDDPLLRSGLAFAGANARREGDDGVLTAAEAAGLDLRGTRLVTLSACQTGLGDVQAGEGVQGLRRALTIAGAETLALSLWKVDDRATQKLMIAFYERLQHGAARTSAMRDAELAMLREPATAHPYYWAAFVVSGNPRALDGREVVPPATPPPVRACACGAAGITDRAPGKLGVALAALWAARRGLRRRPARCLERAKRR